MFNEFLVRNINNGAYGKYIPAAVEVGYAQVEPNHLSAQRTSQVYAQLPAAANIDILQQGQFVKYDYANGEVNFTGLGEWMLVFNEIKLYREGQCDCEFAMIKDNYEARVYSPFGGTKYGNNPDVVDFTGQGSKQTRYYNGVDSDGNKYYTFDERYVIKANDATYSDTTTYYKLGEDGKYTEITDEEKTAYNAMTDEEFAAETLYIENPDSKKLYYDDVTAGADYYEPHYNVDPFHIEALYKEQMMKEGTKMVPRVFKTNVGDIFTTNAIDSDPADLTVGATLKIRKENRDENHKTAGFLAFDDGQDDTLDDKGGPVWQIVKVYTMPDHQKGYKVMRIK